MRSVVSTLVLAAAIGAAGQSPASSPLHIVVLQGEDAVNVIQQRTAVAPVIEVRDRNDLPVPGAVVTFAVGAGQPATFAGGASTLTVTTGVAGQATASGLSPTVAGSLQIQVTASFQGQTAAATITQTNVATAAAAAAVGGVAATTAAPAGGGLSTGALIGIIGGAGAAAGGLVVAKGGSSGGGGDGGATQTTAGTPPAPPTTGTVPLPTCRFTVSPATLAVPIGGAVVTISIAVSPDPCANPSWVVTNIPSFVTVDRTSGSGNGTVTLTIGGFTPAAGFQARTNAIGIAGTVVDIRQPG